MTLTELEGKITDAVKTLSDSVVNISSVKLARDLRFGLIPIEGAGSGVIVHPKGYIVTNNHVVDEAEKLQVILRDGRTFIGEVVGRDPATDIALIRVEADTLPAAKLGDSENLKVGQIVLAIGNALGLPGGPTVSAGVISALGRPLPGTDFVLEGLIQTDAAINPGNSGGPLADLNGNVIGINTVMIAFAQGLGFAIPINAVKGIIEQILENGRVVRPWLGISGVTLNQAIARRYDLPAIQGILVVDASRGSPAYRSGLRGGDILVKVGDREVGQLKDLLAILSKLSIGEEVKISLVRAGTRYETSLRLEEATPPLIARR